MNRTIRWGAAAVAAAAVVVAAWLAGRHDAPAQAVAKPKVIAKEAPTTPIRAVNLPRMYLQAQYSGPLLHTLIQRWRDPIDGSVCYIYLPIAVRHTKPTVQGYVEYDAGSIGSISCTPPPAAVAPRKPPG